MPRTAPTYVDACMHSKDHELGSPKHWKSKFEILKSDFFFHDRYRVVLVACTYSLARYTPMTLSILLSPNTVRVTKHSVILFLLRPLSRSIYTHTTTVFHGAISKPHSNTCHHKRPTSSPTSYSSPYTAYHQQQTLVTNHNTCSL